MGQGSRTPCEDREDMGPPDPAGTWRAPLRRRPVRSGL
ncbi:hypothetical protein N177_4136 [Lutibaculum baratangense AMV1]|uniref:Uncharacterized protein n=1 Tax=Lutibaculum baratangense AMV1 TaxID=631454 RepID=V4R8B6_9HYPH|nr:hypothetical protein N177_4136 [Lutibaculum baratangense AMV1]